MTHTDFATLPLDPALLRNLESLAYHHMTPVQAQSLPAILSGQDVIVQARTGSGKTAAFGLGLLHKLQGESFRIQSLVLCPTRELADQVAEEIRTLARTLANIKVLTLCGGVPIGPQIGSLEHGAHIVVGTPGRIDDHLRKGTLCLDQANTLVLDEADRMLDMGFQPVLDRIVEQIPSARQTLLFSATFPLQIESIAARMMNRPIRITVEEPHDEHSIEQIFSPIEGLSRPEAVRLLLLAERPDAALVFCNTKEDVKTLAQHLSRAGLSTQALHGDLDQKERDQTMVLFDNNSCSVLVATDVAARGLDIEAVDLVINYQIARDSAVHTHRVGRTGRAGRSGKAITLFEERERFKLERLGNALTLASLPDTETLKQPPYRAPMATLQIDGGKKQKVRRGDVLGALTAAGGLQGQDVGKIHLQDLRTYVAVKRADARTALDMINKGKLKGRQFRARLL
ncbi:ATP-dependent RNA helicase DbpA [Marinimicrobium sp. C6131]|uniref:ATP-dependent RNA helicase DbpA n=1 Tax=Marinimicrobium sp. C6131 TaxID=3022676 RepID=UPI00223CBBCF|nr:ATP-dependent RNA helicase DbpA [Marinimicrobium sp. C6131]UZJ45539.1 ATP-dependent RNA helicase DbpA [Marinimicrobium sp. C6131]